METLTRRFAGIVLGLLLGVTAWAGLETVHDITDLNPAWPLGSDQASTADNHIRNIKIALTNDFPNINGAVNATPAELNQLTTNSFTALSASSFTPTSATVPALGIYSSGANALNFATNTVSRGGIDSTGRWSIAAPTSGTGLGITAVSGTGNNTLTSISNDGTNSISLGDDDGAGGYAASLRTTSTGFVIGQNTSARTLDLQTASVTAFRVTGSRTLQGLGPVSGVMQDLTPDAGTFTATYTGCSATTTGTAKWSRVGNLVLLILPALTCTSNATSFTITGLPSAVQPNTTQVVSINSTENNSVQTNSGEAQFTASSGTITMLIGNASGAWTSSGTKGTPLATTLAYSLE